MRGIATPARAVRLRPRPGRGLPRLGKAGFEPAKNGTGSWMGGFPVLLGRLAAPLPSTTHGGDP
eukprot:scaffold3070_cov1604-Pavlova_lutheri.AAC.11